MIDMAYLTIDSVPENAIKATQSLTLGGKGQTAAWNCQSNALKSLASYILMQTGTGSYAGRKRKNFGSEQEQGFSLRRRVFEKVRNHFI